MYKFRWLGFVVRLSRKEMYLILVGKNGGEGLQRPRRSFAVDHERIRGGWNWLRIVSSGGLCY
jgi:hypothetical protein